VELLEREAERQVLEVAIEESRTRGRVVVVTGEAGIGKTALVAAVCHPRQVLWGACDPLITPRPLGPLRDVARQLGGALALAVSGSREEVLAAALDELETWSVLVVEDLHWADDATLDVVALLGRRLARSRGCLVLTCRHSDRPEVLRVLSALPRECVRRVEPAALSADAVALLARRAGREPGDLHAISGGNPFFVTEALAAPVAEAVPASVREAVAARVAAIGRDARAVAELAAVVPGPAELWLVEQEAAAIDECIAAGLLRLDGGALGFRHDLARRAVEDAIPPARRRGLHASVLAALEASGGADPARLVHHARQAGDGEAIRRLAPAAARAASRAGGHRQALEHWEAALAAGAGAAALEGVAGEAYLCGRAERALEARRELLAVHEGDELRAGDDLRWISRLLWWSGRGAEAEATLEQAIERLEAFPASRELAMALSARSQLAMLAERHADAIALGTRAVELARRIGDDETVAHALTNVGSALIGGAENERGRALLEEAHRLAVAGGHDDHATRALVNLATTTLVRRRDDPRGPRDVERALAFAREHELAGYEQYMLGVRANLHLVLGRWSAAEADARASVELGDQPGVSLCPAMIVLGRLRARRGEPDAGATLDEAWRLAVKTQELQRLAPAAAARAEHAWLDGDLARVAELVRDAYALAEARGDVWPRAELAFWLRRAGEPIPAHADDPPPYACAARGDWRGAAAAWAAIGFAYDRADALSEADGVPERLEALAAFDELGAARAAARLRRRLRAAGVRHVPRGPRKASRAAPAGLTPREREVLELVIEGATNAEIARALVIAPKTVDHHVSSVLSKLGISSRREAGAAVQRLA
jgi:DNA-binding CsgD family transcriptional regulator